MTQWNWVKWLPQGLRVLSGWLPELTCLPQPVLTGTPAAHAHRWCYLSQSLSIIRRFGFLIEWTALNERLKNKTASKISLQWLSVINDLRASSINFSSQFAEVPLSLKTLYSKVKLEGKKTRGSISGGWSRFSTDVELMEAVVCSHRWITMIDMLGIVTSFLCFYLVS